MLGHRDQLQVIMQVNERYKLLLEESEILREAAAELVTELLADTGKQYLLKLQACICLFFILCKSLIRLVLSKNGIEKKGTRSLKE